MVFPGHVENGVMVLDGDFMLPEGARGIVSELSHLENGVESDKSQADLPLVPSRESGSVHLTNERIYEVLDEDDIAAMKRTWERSRG